MALLDSPCVFMALVSFLIFSFRRNLYVLLPLVAVLVLVRLLGADATIYNASLASWILYLGIIWILCPLCCLLVVVVKSLLLPVALRVLQDSQIFVFQGIYKSLAFFAWIILTLVAWLVLFAANPMPAHDSSGNKLSLDGSAGWITSLLIGVIFIAGLILLKRIGLLFTIYARRTDSYFERVKLELGRGYVLQHVTAGIAPDFPAQHDVTQRVLHTLAQAVHLPRRSTVQALPDESETESGKSVSQSMVMSPRSRSGSNSSATVLLVDSQANSAVAVEQASAPPSVGPIPVQRSSSVQSATDPTEFAAALTSQMHKHDLDAEFISGSHLVVCGGKTIQSESDAERLGILIYNHFASDSQDGMQFGHLAAALSDRRLAHAAWSLLDVHEKGRLTVDDVKHAIVAIYQDRKHLSRSLHSVDSLFSAANQFMNGIIAFASFFIFLVIFNNTSIGAVLISLSTLLLALSWSFGGVAANVLSSFVLLFVIHPFDSGDYVCVPSIQSDAFHVEHISLLTTTFRALDNRKIQVPNYTLYNSVIQNLHRSKNMHDIFQFDVDAFFTKEKLMEFERRIRMFLKEHDDIFDENASNILFQALYLQDKITLRLDLATRSNWHATNFYKRHHLVLEALKDITAEVRITNHGPTVFHAMFNAENPNYKNISEI